MIAEISLTAVVLSVVLYFIARDEADYEFLKTFYVVLGIIVLNFGVLAVVMSRIEPLSESIGPTGVLVLLEAARFFVVVFMVWKFCWVRLWKAAIVAVVFTLVMTGYHLATGRIWQSLTEYAAPTAEAGERPGRTKKAEPAPARTIASPARPAAGGMDTTNWVRRALDFLYRTAGPPALEPYSDEAWKAAEKSLAISGMLTVGPEQRSVLINGKVVSQNDTLTVSFQDHPYTWTLAQLTATNVQLSPVRTRTASPAY